MRYRYQLGDVTHEVLLERHGEGYRATIGDEVYDLEILDAQPGVLTLHFVSRDAPLRSHAIYWAIDGETKWLSSQGCTYRLERPALKRAARRTPGATSEDCLRAPMPAQVRTVEVAEGDRVEAGQTLLLLEAMKMEIRLQAPRRGRIARILAHSGDTVERDQVLVELED